MAFNFSQGFADNDFASLQPTPSQQTARVICVEEGCGKPITKNNTNVLACGHIFCVVCQDRAVIYNQPMWAAIRFYRQDRNYYGRNSSSSAGDLDAVSTCLFNCPQAVYKDEVGHVPPCPAHIKLYLVWDKMLTRILAHQALRTTDNPRYALMDVLSGDESFNLSKDVSGVTPIASVRATENQHFTTTGNTLNLYDADLVTMTNLGNGELQKKVMLLRLRPKNHATSASAIYAWVNKSMTVGELTTEVYFLRYGRRLPDLQDLHNGFLSLAENNNIFGWDEPLSKVFKHNMTVYTDAE